MTSFPSRFGLASGDNFDLFLKQFAGEVLVAYTEKTMMDGLTRTRNITQGKSAQFPIVGTATAAYHVPGESILETTDTTITDPKYLSTPGTGEKVIHIDNILLAATLISDIDEAMSHWDVRGPYARKLGEALANKYDLSLMQVIGHGANDAAALSEEGSWDPQGDRTVIDTDFETNVESILDTLDAMAGDMDNDDVPEYGRHVVMRPQAYRLLAAAAPDVTAASHVALGSTQTPGVGANVGTGDVRMYNGFMIHKSPRITELAALQNHTAAETGQVGTDYTANFTNTVALAWQEEAAGTVKLMDVNMQMEYSIEYQATLAVARFAVGHGVLREGSCYIVTSS